MLAGRLRPVREAGQVSPTGTMAQVVGRLKITAEKGTI